MAIPAAEVKSPATVPVPHCPRCDSVELRRHGRMGFLQTRVFPYFGLYPWECAQCRRVFMLRRRRAERPASGVRQNLLAMHDAGHAGGLKKLAEKAGRFPSRSRFG